MKANRAILGAALALSVSGCAQIAYAGQPPIADAPYLPGFDAVAPATAAPRLTIAPLPPSASRVKTAQASTECGGLNSTGNMISTWMSHADCEAWIRESPKGALAQPEPGYMIRRQGIVPTGDLRHDADATAAYDVSHPPAYLPRHCVGQLGWRLILYTFKTTFGISQRNFSVSNVMQMPSINPKILRCAFTIIWRNMPVREMPGDGPGLWPFVLQARNGANRIEFQVVEGMPD